MVDFEIGVVGPAGGGRDSAYIRARNSDRTRRGPPGARWKARGGGRVLIRELIAGALDLASQVVGLEGLAIGAVATVVAVLWYLREAADAFVVIARYARVGSLIGFVVLVLLVGGVATGVVDGGSLGSIFEPIAELLH
ncbi:hypothetical protein [Halosimplex pelagicum]|uniref:Uncharacterized protein n=1 Tax=Halosimplex pelagicum TaxID=869886 RepID=A0A7D5TVH8_9EURY|nr:hypothetical protein [Halosimplex pelagicum]QLH83214.1 hypothetical protein HZS54_16955 [Halosimplex pelagicum]